jgi:hypothetical protein
LSRHHARKITRLARESKEMAGAGKTGRPVKPMLTATQGELAFERTNQMAWKIGTIERDTAISLVLGLALFTAVIAAFAAPHETAAPPATTPAEPAATVSCKKDWTQCNGVPDLAKNWKGFTSARRNCQSAAEEQAKYDTKWPWTAFKYYVGEIKDGQLTFVDDEVKYQNGFGAWARVEVHCKYDLQTTKVLNISILER